MFKWVLVRNFNCGNGNDACHFKGLNDHFSVVLHVIIKADQPACMQRLDDGQLRVDVRCSYKNTISYHSVALSTLSFPLCGFVHVFLFYKKPSLGPTSRSFLNFLLFSIVNENKRTKESIVMYPNFY